MCGCTKASERREQMREKRLASIAQRDAERKAAAEAQQAAAAQPAGK